MVRLAGTIVGLLCEFSYSSLTCGGLSIGESLDSWYGSMVYRCWEWQWESLWGGDRYREFRTIIYFQRYVNSELRFLGNQTVFVAPCLIGRIAAPPQQIIFWTMVGVTIVFGSCLLLWMPSFLKIDIG